jgi:shikimate 5-dehydrogenase
MKLPTLDEFREAAIRDLNEHPLPTPFLNRARGSGYKSLQGVKDALGSNNTPKDEIGPARP